jgi:alkylation response protein AidB-like acyl-CoA dehydrogenase
MADYKAPLRDIRFVLNEVFEADKLWQSLPGLEGTIDAETADAMLEEAGKLTSQTIAPLNRNGDEEGARWDNGVVTTPAGFREAVKTYAEGGWVGFGGNPEFGGLGMPKMLGVQVEEMVYGANNSFALYPALTAGCCLALDAHGSEELKQTYLPNLYSGQWAGTMCLTEPHCGTDLGIIRTKAVPQADGSYAVTGTKIFITGGEHDLTENIINQKAHVAQGGIIGRHSSVSGSAGLDAHSYVRLNSTVGPRAGQATDLAITSSDTKP